ncbi:TRIO and F-actin binding protein b [Polypterus senegalus]|uniref:TRIO and F-actin binding protein b n=1 Tax=Polypterus senegalus TaxID=55291 RepID=UPI001965E9D2|nr:TRIO and F-actin binding protein b [Polypterus senegalus]
MLCSRETKPGRERDLRVNPDMTPDLLNFKKGWMSKLDENGEWKKHWFVLTDAGLRYYRDSNAEEVDDLDGEIDLHSCVDVSEFQVQKNYGFQIQTKERVYTLSAMTSGIRRNWIEVLRKSIRPTCAPDVTKLADVSNKENSFTREFPTRRGSSRSELVSDKSDVTVVSQHFDYVELAPLKTPDLTSSENRQALKGEEMERDQAQRIMDRRRWFETPSGGSVPSRTTGHLDMREISGNGPPKKVVSFSGLRGMSSEENVPSTPEQRKRLEEEIEKRWLEFERLPLRETRQVPLIPAGTNRFSSQVNETLEKELASLRQQLDRTKQELETAQRSSIGHVPQGYISQVACERSLETMEQAHAQALQEIQRCHQREIQRLEREKDVLLAEETSATAAAMEALKKAHREELARETEKMHRLQSGGASAELQSLRRQYQTDMESLKHDLDSLSERYSQKCLEVNKLIQTAGEREREHSQLQRALEEARKQNQDLQSRMSEEISRLRTFVTNQGSGDAGNRTLNSCELQVLLRVKENEVAYLQKEITCLRDELETLQKDKKCASDRYKDVYMELSNMKARSEREIGQLREHLRLAMAALQEGQALGNSIGD